MEVLTEFLGACTVLGITVVAIGLMLGFIKPYEAAVKICVMLAIVVLILFAVGLAIAAWGMMAIWQKLGTAFLASLTLLIVFRQRSPHTRSRGNGIRTKPNEH